MEEFKGSPTLRTHGYWLRKQGIVLGIRDCSSTSKIANKDSTKIGLFGNLEFVDNDLHLWNMTITKTKDQGSR